MGNSERFRFRFFNDRTHVIERSFHSINGVKNSWFLNAAIHQKSSSKSMLAVTGLISSQAGPAAGAELRKKASYFFSNIKSCTAVHTPTHTMSRAIQIDKMVWATKRATPTLCVCVQRHSNLQMSLQTTSFFSREIIAFFALLLLLLLSAEICFVQRCSLKNKYRDVLTNQLGSHFDCAVVLRHNRFCTTSSTSLNGSNGAGGE
jgi:hypothetical protein